MPDDSKKTVLGGCELLAKTGQGTVGPVYKAKRQEDGATVAVKVLSRDLAANRHYTARFEQQARLAHQVNDPHLVNVLDSGRDGDFYYVVSEWAGGETVAAALERGGRVPEASALGIISQTAAGLHAAHKLGLFHLNLKPQNILIAPGNSVKVMDIGIARPPSTCEGAVPSPNLHYTAPEQVEPGKVAGPAADLYALGAILFHMVTGKPPFEGQVPGEVLAKHVAEPPRAATEVAPDVSHGTSALIQKMMAKDPARRHANMAALSRDIKTIASGGVIPLDKPTAEPLPLRPAAAVAAAGPSWGKRIAAGLLLLAALGVAGFMAWREGWLDSVLPKDKETHDTRPVIHDTSKMSDEERETLFRKVSTSD